MVKNERRMKCFWMCCVFGFMLVHASRQLGEEDTRKLEGVYIQIGKGMNIQVVDVSIEIDKNESKKKVVVGGCMGHTFEFKTETISPNKPPASNVSNFYLPASNGGIDILNVKTNGDIFMYEKEKQKESWSLYKALYKFKIKNTDDKNSLKTLRNVFEDKENWREFNNNAEDNEGKLKYNNDYVVKLLEKLTLPDKENLISRMSENIKPENNNQDRCVPDEKDLISQMNENIKPGNNNQDWYVYLYCSCFSIMTFLTYYTLRSIMKRPKQVLEEVQTRDILYQLYALDPAQIV